MKRFLSLRLELILLTGILGLISTACNSFNTAKLPKKQNPQVAMEPLVIPQPAKLLPPKVEPDRFESALDKAYGALTITQSAQGVEDWQLIAAQWSEAIALMKTVPAHSPYKLSAQKKIIQYQQNLKYAQQQVIRPIPPRPAPVRAMIPPASMVRTPVQPTPILAPTSSGVFQAAIKTRHGGTPVVEVTFNGSTQFEMIVDTGASGTVITQQMAAVLGVAPIGKATANTASDRNVEFSIGNVNSIEVGGAVINNVPVAIAPTANLDLGLLGQDFFSNYDVTIKRDIVEFRPR